MSPWFGDWATTPHVIDDKKLKATHLLLSVLILCYEFCHAWLFRRIVSYNTALSDWVIK